MEDTDVICVIFAAAFAVFVIIGGWSIRNYLSCGAVKDLVEIFPPFIIVVALLG